MAAAPRFKIYSPSGEYVAAVKYPEDAAHFAHFHGPGATVRLGHSRAAIVWREGSEETSAAESLDRAAEIIRNRADELWSNL